MTGCGPVVEVELPVDVERSAVRGRAGGLRVDVELKWNLTARIEGEGHRRDLKWQDGELAGWLRQVGFQPDWSSLAVEKKRRDAALAYWHAVLDCPPPSDSVEQAPHSSLVHREVVDAVLRDRHDTAAWRVRADWHRE